MIFMNAKISNFFFCILYCMVLTLNHLSLDECCRDGNLVKCEIYGEVQVNSHLSGLPDLTLSFANPSILDDVRFHPCVRFRPWESDQILSFVPPDGQFKLMSYRFVVLRRKPCHNSTLSLFFLITEVITQA